MRKSKPLSLRSNLAKTSTSQLLPSKRPRRLHLTGGAGSRDPSSTRSSKPSKPSKVQESKRAGGGGGAPKGRKPREIYDFLVQILSEQELLISERETTRNNNNRAESCGCALLQRLSKVFQHCGGPLSAATFSSTFQPPPPALHLGGCRHLELIPSQTFRNWQAVPKLATLLQKVRRCM